MNRFKITLAVVALAAVAVAALAGTGTAATSDTLQLAATLTATKQIDAAPKGHSPGDRSLASGTLVDTATNKKAGRILLSCVDMPAGTGECELTFALPGGHVAVLASYGRGFSGESSAHDPIVGGTGTYATARGYTDEVETGEGKMHFTLHLER